MNSTFSFIACFFALLFFQQYKAQSCRSKFHSHKGLKTSSIYNLRSDTIDVKQYKLDLDFTTYLSDSISGSCEVVFESRMNGVSKLNLDLLSMNVDSVKKGNSLLSFTYNDTLLSIDLPVTLNTSDTDSLIVWYNGEPVRDISGFGGMYFQGNYAYNLGVAFSDIPHNYGRVWHPCFDNFVERATYKVHIKSPVNASGYANGLIIADSTDGTANYRTWSISNTIPTYLATVAVANYTHVEQTFTSSVTGINIPMYLIAEPSDTASFKASFANLSGAMEGFEERYGPYLWEKVGFHSVPFGSGAMEHATDIAYPGPTINGQLTYETLMAHELAHSWWGNLVTCRTAEEMWINEGMASFSERIFLEWIYGHERYISDVRNNHKSVLQNAHINDDGYYALDAVPQEVTYGDHSYNKGADVAHTLRGYMGDSLFFEGLKAVLLAYPYEDISSIDFRDEIIASTGYDATDFFDDWISNPGFAAYYIDSFISNSNGGSFDVDIYVHQKLKGTSHFHSNTPITITFMDQNWNEYSEQIICSGEYSNHTVTVPFDPSFVYLNGDDKVSIAVTGDNQIINGVGIKDLSYSLIRYNTSGVSDSALVRTEHYWVAPDGFKTSENDWEFSISEERFWHVDGIWPSDFQAGMRVFLDGRTIGANLDNLLVAESGFTEDSVRLLHRENAASNWKAVNDFNINTIGSAFNGHCFIEIDTLKKGDYALGWKYGITGLNESNRPITMEVFPNPVTDWLNINIEHAQFGRLTIKMFDLNGKLIYNEPFSGNYIDVKEFAHGTYLISVSNKQGKVLTESKFVKH